MITTRSSEHLEHFKAEAHRLKEKATSLHSEKNVDGREHLRDRVSLGRSSLEPPTYHPAEMEALLDAKYAQLRDLVVKTLNEQGVATRVALPESEIDIASLSPEEASALVAEDGYFGVDQTSQRIVDFAIGLAGDDPSRLEAILKGIDEGFSAAEDAWDGELPEISYRTRDAIQQKLASWQESRTHA